MKTKQQHQLWKTLGRVAVVAAMIFGLCSWPVGGWAAEQAGTIQVSLGGAMTLRAENFSKLAIADPAVADVLPLSDKEISVIGKKAGFTTLTVVFGDGKPTKMYNVIVGNDPAAATIRELVNQPGLTVRAVGDTLVLDGQVDDEIALQRATAVAAAYKDKIVNLAEVRAPRQIKIQVRIAEVSTTITRKMGLKWLSDGSVSYGFELSGVDNVLDPITHGTLSPDVTLEWLESKGYARLLSEPTLITRSGSEASFLVGSEIPIIQTLQATSTVEYKEVGVRMKIKPTADSQNRINTVIHAEVSQVSGESVRGVGGVELPVILSRKAEAVLQVNDGQTMVISGLLDNNIDTDTLRKFPWLADIPVLGALFRHKGRSGGQRELVFFMTPTIVRDAAQEVNQAARTPMLRDWNNKSKRDVLPIPDPKEDWGLHDLQNLGFKDRLAEPAPAARPAAAPAPEPTKNFVPARPAGQ